MDYVQNCKETVEKTSNTRNSGNISEDVVVEQDLEVSVISSWREGSKVIIENSFPSSTKWLNIVYLKCFQNLEESNVAKIQVLYECVGSLGWGTGGTEDEAGELFQILLIFFSIIANLMKLPFLIRKAMHVPCRSLHDLAAGLKKPLPCLACL